MADINDIKQDIESIENLITGPDGLIKTKLSIKRAIESKLNTSIDDTVPLRTYDDYIYHIPVSSEEAFPTLVLNNPGSVGGIELNFKPEDEIKESVFFNPNGEVDTNTEVYELDPTKNYGGLSGVKINKPEGLIGENIKNGVNIFGIEGTGVINGSDVSGVTATQSDVSENKTFVDSTGNPLQGTLRDNRGSILNSGSTEYIYNDDDISNITRTLILKPSEATIIDTNGVSTSIENVVNAYNESGEDGLVSENIKSGTTIMGVTGTFTSVDDGEEATSLMIREGKVAYVNGERIDGVVKYRNPSLQSGNIQINRNNVLTLKAGMYIGNDPDQIISQSPAMLPAEFTVDQTHEVSFNDQPTDNILSYGGNLNVTPKLNVTLAGYLPQNNIEGDKFNLTATDLINQYYFTDEYLESNGLFSIRSNKLLEDTVGVDQNGQVFRGSIPKFTNNRYGTLNWKNNLYNPAAGGEDENHNQIGGIITYPTNNTQWGYYDNASRVLLTDKDIRGAYNYYWSANMNRLLVSDNIKSGATILGVEGNYSGEVTLNSIDVSPALINFKNSNTVVFTPSAGTGYNKVTLNKDSSLKPENIKSGSTIFDVSGTFTKNPSTTGNILAKSSQILDGYTAWSNGQEYDGSIKNYGNVSRIITDPWSVVNLNTGYYNSIKVGVDQNQLKNLTEFNIRSGVTIFGVTGNYSGGKEISLYCNQTSGDPEISVVPNLIRDSSGNIILHTDSEGNPLNTNNRFNVYCNTEGVNFNLLSAPVNSSETNPYITDIPVGSNLCFHIIPLFSDYPNYAGYPIGNCRAKILIKRSPDDDNPLIKYDSYIPAATIAQVKEIPASGGVTINYQVTKPIKVEFRLYVITAGEPGLVWEITIIELTTNLYDTSSADPIGGNGAAPEDVAAGKIFFNNTGSHNGTLIDGRAGVISVNSSLECYNSDNNVFYFHPVNNSIIDSGLNPPIDASEYFVLQSGLAVGAGYIGQNTPNLSAGNIKSGVNILGVTGSLSVPQITQDPVTGIVTII